MCRLIPGVGLRILLRTHKELASIVNSKIDTCSITRFAKCQEVLRVSSGYPFHDNNKGENVYCGSLLSITQASVRRPLILGLSWILLT